MAAVDGFLFGLASIALACWCFQWCIHLMAIIYSKWRLHSKLPAISKEVLPAVSILKPLTGVDPHLYENLNTFFQMDYPQYELLFCIEEDTDPAVMVVNSLLAKYPQIDARLFIGAKKVGVNPKINNMMQGYEAAKYQHILISDSGLRMRPDTLTDIVCSLLDNVGLVHQMPYVCDRDGFAGILEKVYFGTQHAKMYLSADLLGINCVTGMSCLFRKQVVDEAGGLKALGQYLAEDYYLGQAFMDRGWKISICSQPAWQNAGNYTIANFQARMMRWAKLRSSLVPITIFLEPTFEYLLLGLMSSWAVTVIFHWSGLAFFLVHTLLWFLLDYILLRIIQNGTLPFSKFEYVIGWLLREYSSVYLMARAHATPHLTWRNKKYILKGGGMGEEVKTRFYEYV